MRADCQRKAREGVLDMTYLERRLDGIEARLDDLCGLLGEVLDKLGVGEVETSSPMDLRLEGIWGEPNMATGDSQSD